MRTFRNGINPLVIRYCDKVPYLFSEDNRIREEVYIPVQNTPKSTIYVTVNEPKEEIIPVQYYYNRRQDPIQYVLPTLSDKNDLVYYVESHVPFRTNLTATRFAPKNKVKRRVRIAPETYATFGVFPQ